MLVQTLNAISRRFQNVRGGGDRDPLAHLEIDPLRPLNNLLWGYIQDEQNRLTVKRRAYEYDHHYGLTHVRQGGADAAAGGQPLEVPRGVPSTCCIARSIFYKEDNDTTVIADGFPLLNALKEVHLLLAQGAHNQFGDLPWTARVEMLIQQWLLARPGDARVPAEPPHGALHRGVDAAGRHHEDAAGLVGCDRSRTSATSASMASRSCCRSATATGSTSTTRTRPRTGRVTGGRRSRDTCTPIAR